MQQPSAPPQLQRRGKEAKAGRASKAKARTPREATESEAKDFKDHGVRRGPTEAREHLQRQLRSTGLATIAASSATCHASAGKDEATPTA